MSALKRLGGGSLTSVDPYQLSYFRGAGAEFVKKAGLSDMHTLVVKADYLYLPQLVSEGQTGKFDFAYIDGNHTFDYTLLDAWYLDHTRCADRRRPSPAAAMADGCTDRLPADDGQQQSSDRDVWTR